MKNSYFVLAFIIFISSSALGQNPVCDSILLNTAPEFCLDTYAVALWHFNEGAGDTAYDATNNNNDGVIYGATWVDGKFGKALNYNPSDTSHVLVPNSTSLQITGAITMEAWIESKNTGPGPLNLIVQKGDGGFPGGNSYWFALQGDKKLQASLTTPGDSYWELTGDSSIVLNNFYYVAMTWNGDEDTSSIKFYLNGIVDTAVSVGLTSIQVSNSPLGIGFTPISETYYFDGIIDEVRISKIARLPRGYLNGDGLINISDIVYEVNYVLKSGPPPIPRKEIGDVNCDCDVNITDIIYLVNYVFKGGCKPCILLG